MNKLELIQKLSAALGDDKDDLAKKTIDLFFDRIKQSLISGENVEIRGFGVFKVKTKNVYIGRNPKTGKKVKIPTRKHPSFKAGLKLKERINP